MNKLRDLRVRNGISQKELADKLNISRESISKYENGIQEPNYAVLKRISRFFNVSIDFLLGSSEDELIVITKQDLSRLKNAANIISDITSKLSSGININIGDHSPSNINIGLNKKNKN